jgi:hypothetical protein
MSSCHWHSLCHFQELKIREQQLTNDLFDVRTQLQSFKLSQELRLPQRLTEWLTQQDVNIRHRRHTGMIGDDYHIWTQLSINQTVLNMTYSGLNDKSYGSIKVNGVDQSIDLEMSKNTSKVSQLCHRILRSSNDRNWSKLVSEVGKPSLAICLIAHQSDIEWEKLAP